MQTHLIDTEALRGDDFDAFFNARREALIAKIEQVMGKPVVRSIAGEPEAEAGFDEPETESEVDFQESE